MHLRGGVTDSRHPQLAHSPEQELRLVALVAWVVVFMTSAGSFTRTGIETQGALSILTGRPSPAGSFTRTGIETEVSSAAARR